jgi:hypothetical protein
VIFPNITQPIRIRFLASILFSALALQAVLARQAPASQPAAHKRVARKTTKKIAVEPPPAPVPPPPPATLEQMPALPPQVQYSNGQLTIMAENSTLSDILRAVRTQLKAEVEIPSNANERVVGHFGPGSARDVLNALLHGVHFNYVMVGSAAHPDGVDRLILTSKSGGAPDPGTAMAAPSPQVTTESPADEAAAPDVEPPTEDDAETANTNGETPPPPTPDGQQQAKTPEQLLRELQQQQLLQQQLQQQQGQQPGAPPPN